MRHANAGIFLILLASFSGVMATPKRRTLVSSKRALYCCSKPSGVDTIHATELVHPEVRGGATNFPGWEEYNTALDKHPLCTKAVTALLGWALGDFIAQVFFSNNPFVWQRILITSFFGLAFFGPSGHVFYNWLDSQLVGTRGRMVLTKILVDQLVWAPLVYIAFFAYVELVHGNAWTKIGQKLQRDLFPVCQASWRVWPLVHSVNFKFISTKHRLIFVNGVQIAFNAFLSIVAFNDKL